VAEKQKAFYFFLVIIPACGRQACIPGRKQKTSYFFLVIIHAFVPEYKKLLISF
jgi:hypothetical protein